MPIYSVSIEPSQSRFVIACGPTDDPVDLAKKLYHQTDPQVLAVNQWPDEKSYDDDNIRPFNMDVSMEIEGWKDEDARVKRHSERR